MLGDDNTALGKFIAAPLATSDVNHVRVTGLYSAIHALVKVHLARGTPPARAIACGLLDSEDSSSFSSSSSSSSSSFSSSSSTSSASEQAVPRPNAKELQSARRQLTNAICKGDVDNVRLPAAIRGDALRNLMPSSVLRI
ncbi:hypothetical protein T492DRAFT_840665 [Pavlovales sp. CCMP2436]|nr:hypothetical protein T492DRAFT_840665 [Pavlovales sp. CCMP2436]